MQKLTSAKLKDLLVKTLKDHKAIDIEILNVKKISDLTDYMIVATANSTTHAKALAEKSREALAKLKIRPISIEGETTREWMLADFDDVILHIMLEPTRKFYALEKLWGITKEKKRG